MYALGLFLGCGVTRPWALRMRQMVESAGDLSPVCSRCQAIEAAPASRPCESKPLRNSTIWLRISTLRDLGLVFGLRERASSASRPPAL
jgi:hypothetical protein